MRFNRQRPVLAMVFPCFNEEDALPDSMEKIDAAISKMKIRGLIADSSFVLYVDDGSSDKTWELIMARCHGKNGVDSHSKCRGLKLAGNAGHQNALYAGLVCALEAGVDCAVSMDVDLQDDIDVVPALLAEFSRGCDLVYGVRRERETDIRFKRLTACIYYRLLRFLNVKLIPHHGDCRLCSRLALEGLSQINENDLFLRALFPNFGLRSSVVEYSRKMRLHGVTKYTFRKMVSLAWRGITSFSVWPLRIAGLFSVVSMMVAMIQTFIVLYAWCKGISVPGWSSLMIVILFMGSVQLFCLTIIGEYLAKTYMETKKRPRYIVEKLI